MSLDHFRPPAKKLKTIESFFKSKRGDKSSELLPSTDNVGMPTSSHHEHGTSQQQKNPSYAQPTISSKAKEVVVQRNGGTYERDPGLRCQIYEYPVNQRDEVRRSYLRQGPFKPRLSKYPPTWDGRQDRYFQYSWLRQHSWLEYSIEKNKAYCFPCFIFETDPPKRPAFTIEGFSDFKHIGSNKTVSTCSFVQHVGHIKSSHMVVVEACENIRRPSRHIDSVFRKQSKELIAKNRLRLKVAIETVRVLGLHACPFRGNDESLESTNRGKFIGLMKYATILNDKIVEVVLGNAPGKAMYTSPKIQKEIIHILANKVKDTIRAEIGDAKFCILVDEAQDSSVQEKMAIVLRFVDTNGCIRERFFAVRSVEDTTSLTLKREISESLASHGLLVENIRGQGYDGASNMRGAWNGLQALFLRDCPYAYYVHCCAHRLQLALVEAATDEQDVYLFFEKLKVIVKLVGASPKRHSQLKSAAVLEVATKLADGELETGSGANQTRTLKRAADTRWSSHFGSVFSLIRMYNPACIVLQNVMKNGNTSKIRGMAEGAYLAIRSFEFVFILHLVGSVMAATEVLCQALQKKTQDIVNAMNLVKSTKVLLQELRDKNWVNFFGNVKSFCDEHDIVLPEFSDRYMMGTGRSCQQKDHITIEHHYRVDIFNAVIDFHLLELSNRFTEESMELLVLCSAFSPDENYKAFDIDSLCSLAERFYPDDFTGQEVCVLRSQLQHYKLDIADNPDFGNMTTVAELCQRLVETGKSNAYDLIDRLIRLVLTLPVSTASAERVFSCMNIVKTVPRNKMGNEFLGDCMIVHAERQIAEKVSCDSIIDDFASLRPRKVQFS
ncbi:zinc finger MYM-type protein 1-like [Papaver somniferum]|uniref:zinc finger MYM-type protein 1-like n=1 Tax=Papaver somniferum TaxID=3469 RepID=UPI000E6FC3E8|nr:zinc finger MYM-type protein 1-like [Papaver somniferum]